MGGASYVMPYAPTANRPYDVSAQELRCARVYIARLPAPSHWCGMSAAATSFVRRHVLVHVNRTKGLVMSTLADVADDAGNARMTQAMVATDLGCALSTVTEAWQGLKAGGYLTKGRHRTWVIAGVAEHHVMTCDHIECAAEADSIRRGGTSARKRRLAAERARRFRERQKKAAQNV